MNTHPDILVGAVYNDPACQDLVLVTEVTRSNGIMARSLKHQGMVLYRPESIGRLQHATDAQVPRVDA